MERKTSREKRRGKRREGGNKGKHRSRESKREKAKKKGETGQRKPKGKKTRVSLWEPWLTVLHHDHQELDHDLAGWPEHDLTLASALGVGDALQSVVECTHKNHGESCFCILNGHKPKYTTTSERTRIKTTSALLPSQAQQREREEERKRERKRERERERGRKRERERGREREREKRTNKAQRTSPSFLAFVIANS